MGTKVCLINLCLQDKSRKEKVVWILDSGCSRHMTGEKSLLADVVEKPALQLPLEMTAKGLLRDMVI